MSITVIFIKAFLAYFFLGSIGIVAVSEKYGYDVSRVPHRESGKVVCIAFWLTLFMILCTSLL